MDFKDRQISYWKEDIERFKLLIDSFGNNHRITQHYHGRMVARYGERVAPILFDMQEGK